MSVESFPLAFNAFSKISSALFIFSRSLSAVSINLPKSFVFNICPNPSRIASTSPAVLPIAIILPATVVKPFSSSSLALPPLPTNFLLFMKSSGFSIPPLFRSASMVACISSILSFSFPSIDRGSRRKANCCAENSLPLFLRAFSMSGQLTSVAFSPPTISSASLFTSNF